MHQFDVLWPTLKRCDSEKCQHSLADVVEVEVLIQPFATRHDGLVDVAVFEFKKIAPENNHHAYSETN